MNSFNYMKTYRLCVRLLIKFDDRPNFLNTFNKLNIFNKNNVHNILVNRSILKYRGNISLKVLNIQ